jgi:hypothetical protein
MTYGKGGELCSCGSMCVYVCACVYRVWDARDGSVPSHLLKLQLAPPQRPSPAAAAAVAAPHARRSAEPATHLPSAAATRDDRPGAAPQQQQIRDAATSSGPEDRAQPHEPGGQPDSAQADTPANAPVQNNVRFVDNGRTIVSAGASPQESTAGLSAVLNAPTTRMRNWRVPVLGRMCR